MNALEKQIKDMYAKVFYESIDDTINSEKPDYDWIVSLYGEIKGRLIKFIKKDSSVYKQIDAQFDIDLFRQMIEHDIFNTEDLMKLINTTFEWIKFLGAPARDEVADQAKMRILSSEPNKIVSTFIKEVNICIDYIDEDIINFIKETKGL
jgi:hypothetical protein